MDLGALQNKNARYFTFLSAQTTVPAAYRLLFICTYSMDPCVLRLCEGTHEQHCSFFKQDRVCSWAFCQYIWLGWFTQVDRFTATRWPLVFPFSLVMNCLNMNVWRYGYIIPVYLISWLTLGSSKSLFFMLEIIIYVFRRKNSNPSPQTILLKNIW